MDSLTGTEQELKANGAFPFRRIHTPDPEPPLGRSQARGRRAACGPFVALRSEGGRRWREELTEINKQGGLRYPNLT